jgi:hypothetical protein
MSGPLYGNINQENRNYLKVLITKHFKPTTRLGSAHILSNKL